MSCNPSFGGIGKGHLVREVDALDGVCGRLCDRSAITYQALNRARGPAVLGLRAQIDRYLYRRAMQKEILETTPNLEVLEGGVEDLCLEEPTVGIGEAHRVKGCVLQDGTIVEAKCVVITTGTFLSARIFRGLESWPAGRMGDPASNGLSRTFSRLGFALGRLRTGTPPRLYLHTIDFSKFEVVPPDAKSIPFSFMTDQVWLPPEKQLPTYVGNTNEDVARLVQKNINENLHIREEQALGPRYCPSLEAKVLRFSHLHHRFFLEPEGLDSDLIYPQGMSMTFRTEAQLEIMRAIPGLERVELAQPGYSVHYDFINPQQLRSTLETKKVEGLFLAGQINGTTGYEEAAGQGILAGANAALKVLHRKPLVIDRSQGYIGVLVDDLTTLGTNEPYRMFTSRAEFRLHLRPDNADFRLTELGRRAGIVSDERYDRYLRTLERYETVKGILESVKRPLGAWSRLLPTVKRTDGRMFNGYEILYRHQVKLAEIAPHVSEELMRFVDDETLEERLVNEGRYSMQNELLMKKFETVRQEMGAVLPEDLRYTEMLDINDECREKLEHWRPQTIAAASRIPGITPDALITLLRYAKNTRHAQEN
ncbi:tRNA uridine 5-carboxymethylaminomethyl modification enzyme, partial [Aphelenchoides avenae]